MMKLVVLACLVAAALARPDKLDELSSSQLGQFRQQTFDGVARQQSYAAPSQVQQQTYAAPSRVQQQTYEPPSQVRQQTYAAPSRVQQQTYEPPQNRQQSQTTYGSPATEKLSEVRLRDRNAAITSFTNERTDAGAQHSFPADNGLKRTETLKLQEVVTLDEYGKEVVSVVPVYSGEFQFQLDDGRVVTRSYHTDVTGRLVFAGTDLPQGCSSGAGCRHLRVSWRWHQLKENRIVVAFKRHR